MTLLAVVSRMLRPEVVVLCAAWRRFGPQVLCSEIRTVGTPAAVFLIQGIDSKLRRCETGTGGSVRDPH